MGSRAIDLRRIEVVDETVAEILRRKSASERLQMAFHANQMARMLVEGGIRAIHPDWNQSQIRLEIARRMLGTD